MKSKLIVLGVIGLMLSINSSVVYGGMEKGSMMEHKGSMMEEGNEKFSKDAVMVGNKICPVSKKPVDRKGDPVKVEYNGKIYNVCCKMCAKSFKKDPEKYSKIVEEMMEKAHDEDGHGH